jgi:AP-4 complex subunit epsilon-1
MEGNKAIAALVEEAANHVSQMLRYSTGQVSGTNGTRTSSVRNYPPRNPNVQYVALQCLTEIIAFSPRYATPHQLVLMQCLYDPDESIQRTTLELLCKMTTVSNVVVVVEQLLVHLQRQTDVYLRTELIQRITSLAEKFAPSPEWYIKVMLRTLRVGGDLITLRHSVVAQLIHALRTGTGDSDMTRTLRTHALTHALDHLSALSSGEPLPDILILTIAWIIGEYGHLHSTLSPSAILELLGDLLERQYICTLDSLVISLTLHTQ